MDADLERLLCGLRDLVPDMGPDCGDRGNFVPSVDWCLEIVALLVEENRCLRGRIERLQPGRLGP